MVAVVRISVLIIAFVAIIAFGIFTIVTSVVPSPVVMVMFIIFAARRHQK